MRQTLRATAHLPEENEAGIIFRHCADGWWWCFEDRFLGHMNGRENPSGPFASFDEAVSDNVRFVTGLFSVEDKE